MGFCIQIELNEDEDLLGVSLVSESDDDSGRIYDIGMAVKGQLTALMPDLLYQACVQAKQPVEKVIEGYTSGTQTLN